MRFEVLSVFSVAKAEAASTAAMRAGVVQDVLLRVPARGTSCSPGWRAVSSSTTSRPPPSRIRELPGVRITGVTTFPALSYAEADVPRLTPSFTTLLRAADALRRLNVDVTQINAPGNTATHVLPVLAAAGATHVEPGSALSGHTTFHLLRDDLPERPAAVYVTEISHFVDGQAWTFGGGFFTDDPPVPQLVDFPSRRAALVGDHPERVVDHPVRFLGTGPAGGSRFGGIDYHGLLEVNEGSAKVGDTVVFGFRTQVFVTRAYVGVVKGVTSGTPSFAGLFDVQGHRLDPVSHW